MNNEKSESTDNKYDKYNELFNDALPVSNLKQDFDITIKELSDKNIISPRLHTDKEIPYKDQSYNSSIPIRKSTDDKDLIKKSL
jgi:hypothetical protein